MWGVGGLRRVHRSVHSPVGQQQRRLLGSDDQRSGGIMNHVRAQLSQKTQLNDCAAQ